MAYRHAPQTLRNIKQTEHRGLADTLPGRRPAVGRGDQPHFASACRWRGAATPHCGGVAAGLKGGLVGPRASWRQRACGPCGGPPGSRASVSALVPDALVWYSQRVPETATSRPFSRRHSPRDRPVRQSRVDHLLGREAPAWRPGGTNACRLPGCQVRFRRCVTRRCQCAAAGTAPLRHVPPRGAPASSTGSRRGAVTARSPWWPTSRMTTSLTPMPSHPRPRSPTPNPPSGSSPPHPSGRSAEKDGTLYNERPVSALAKGTPTNGQSLRVPRIDATAIAALPYSRG